MNFGKMTMIICNYSDAGQLQKHPLTSREKYYATPLYKPLDFSQWIHYFLFIGAQPIGPMHEYYDF